MVFLRKYDIQIGFNGLMCPFSSQIKMTAEIWTVELYLCAKFRLGAQILIVKGDTKKEMFIVSHSLTNVP